MADPMVDPVAKRASTRRPSAGASRRGRRRIASARRCDSSPRLLLAFLGLVAIAVASPTATASEADVVAAEAHCNDARTVCRFTVTIRHADAGWDHYADRWDILAPDGKVLGERVLRHPHVNEQPFTRSMPAIRIPSGVTKVRIRAHDKIHGLGGAEIEVTL